MCCQTTNGQVERCWAYAVAVIVTWVVAAVDSAVVGYSAAQALPTMPWQRALRWTGRCQRHSPRV